MADIAPKLLHLSAEKLLALHERIHKSAATPSAIEVHHLILNEMGRRGMTRPQDGWDEYEILVDSIEGVDLHKFSSALPKEIIVDVINKSNTSFGDIKTVLTVDGYEMRIEPEILEKTIRREKGKYVVYNEEMNRKFGSYDTRREAEARLRQIERFSKASYTPPQPVREAAKRALAWIEEGKAGSGFTSVGRTRAGQLARGESISLETLKRMKSFFSRHEVDKKAKGFSRGEDGYPSGGRVAWDAWGGDAGYAWAEAMVAEAERAVEKHNEGKHDQKTHGAWADQIVQQMLDGQHPEVESNNVSSLFMKMAKRSDHPDITEIKVSGTLLFGDEGMGIARKDMPQIDASRRPEFLNDLKAQGINMTEEDIDPKTLKPIQKEISGSRSGAIYERYRQAGAIPDQQRILISKDGYVIDGHHTWAASVAFALDNDGAKLPVYRLDVNGKDALDASLAWTKSKGIEGQAIDAKKARFLEPGEFFKHEGGEGHDQASHGNWAQGRAETIASGRIPSIKRDADGRVINPNATGGYKAGMPESATFKGKTYTPEDSLWHHLEPDGQGGFRLTEERRLLHSQIVTRAVDGVPESAEPTFYMLGGGPSSGKTTFLKSGVTDTPDKTEAVHINADDLKELLPENPRMRDSDDADFFNAARFSHEESSLLAKAVQAKAISNQQDIVLDGTGDSDIANLSSKVEQARTQGYKVNGVYVTIPTDVAWDRSVARALGSTKRFVPETVVRSTHRAVSGTLRQAIEGGLFDSVSLWDNSTRTPKLIGRGQGTNFQVEDSDLWNKFLKKETE
jgi:predicted ABC-type ATPase